MSTPVAPALTDSATPAARYQRALEEIYHHLNYERTPDAAQSLVDFRLTQMEELLSGLGDPQLSVPTVHVAGSKGKGSTATMIARIAEAAGYRVGLFTSPHVDRFEERFTINGVPPTPEQVADLYDQLRPIAERIQARFTQKSPTFFELTTALSWLHFANQQVDLAVMEVGLGGRLDSTNVCQPLVTVITSISRDHTRLLGNTLAEISREKAGIIKQGIPIVTAVTNPEPADVIGAVALEKSAPLYRLGEEFQQHPHLLRSDETITNDPPAPACYQFNFAGMGVHAQDLQLRMPGEHQTRNGAVATAVAILLRNHGLQLTESAIRAGLLKTSCPLRVEVVQHAPLIIVDAAHNPASVAALCESLREVPLNRRIVIFGSSRDKEADALLRILDQHMDEIWLTQFTNNPRGIELEELQRIAGEVLTKPWRSFETPRVALESAKAQSGKRDLICVTGSFFLAAEAKAILCEQQMSTGS